MGYRLLIQNSDTPDPVLAGIRLWYDRAQRLWVIQWIDREGNQLSEGEVTEGPAMQAFFAALKSAGVVCDFRAPNIIRAAPVPLYNSFHDAWRFVRALATVCK